MILLRTACYTMRAVLRQPWPVNYHDFGEPRPYDVFESHGGSHWQERGAFGTPPSNARRAWKLVSHAVMLPFAALSVVLVLAAIPLLTLLDKIRGRI
jgi:hypothetical protein